MKPANAASTASAQQTYWEAMEALPPCWESPAWPTFTKATRAVLVALEAEFWELADPSRLRTTRLKQCEEHKA